MTDITELAQSLKAAAVRAKTATEEYASGHMSVSVCYAECEEFNRLTDGPDNILALVEALETAQAAERRWHRVASRIHEQACESDVKIDELEAIRAAAEKLVRCKGRYHSEQNYRALAALFGVTAPDLPPLDGESSTVTVKLPDIMPPEAAPAHYWVQGESMAYADGYNKSAADLKTSIAQACSSAGVNVEFE